MNVSYLKPGTAAEAVSLNRLITMRWYTTAVMLKMAESEHGHFAATLLTGSIVAALASFTVGENYASSRAASISPEAEGQICSRGRMSFSILEHRQSPALDCAFNNLPPHPITHRPQACAVLVPQDA
jgi:hypothetical protein